jgi:hypothetical protein
MTTIATQHGNVSGTSPALVAAAAAVLDGLSGLPRQRRYSELVAAVTLPWELVSI